VQICAPRRSASQIAVHLRIAEVAVVAPAGGKEKIHDVEAEAEIAGAGLLVEEPAGRGCR